MPGAEAAQHQAPVLRTGKPQRQNGGLTAAMLEVSPQVALPFVSSPWRLGQPELLQSEAFAPLS